MNETLILLTGESPDTPVDWAFFADGRIVLADTAASVPALSAIAERAARARLVAAVLPGSLAAMRALSAPPKSQRQFRAAAGFLLEDELAENIEAMQVAVVRHESGAGVALAVRKTVIEDWLAAFAEAGLAPDMLTADVALVSGAADTAVLFASAERVFGVVGLNGFSLDRPLADDIAPGLLADAALNEITIYGTLDGVPWTEGVVVHRHEPLDHSVLAAIYAERLAVAPNLRQGAYRKKRDWKAAAGPWRRTAVLAAASLAVLMVTTIATGVRDIRIADRLQEEARLLHEAAFPGAVGADPRTHARQVLAAGGGKPQFLLLTNAIAESVEASGVRIDRIRFNATREEYAVNLQFTDIAQFETLKRLLEGRGLRAAEAGGVRRTDTVYVGELRVSQP